MIELSTGFISVWSTGFISVWQFSPQWPQCPRTWSPLESTFVEHQSLPSGSFSVVHELWTLPLNLKGNLHGFDGVLPRDLVIHGGFGFTIGVEAAWIGLSLTLIDVWRIDEFKL